MIQVYYHIDPSKLTLFHGPELYPSVTMARGHENALLQKELGDSVA